MTDEETEEFLYGKGIELQQNTSDPDDKHWDIVIDGSGDVGVNRGVGELEKDLAFKLRRTLDGMLGRHITPSLRERIKSRAERTVGGDERIEEVTSVSIVSGDETKDFRLEVEAVAIGRDIISINI